MTTAQGGAVLATMAEVTFLKTYLVLSDSPWRSVPTRTQQLITRLKDSSVLFFEPDNPHAASVKGPGRQVRPNVTVYTLPPVRPVPDGADFLRRRLYKKQADAIHKVTAQRRVRDAVLWTTSPEHVHLLDQLTYRGLVYDCGQDWSDLPPQWEGDLAAAADVVFAASPGLADRLSPCNGNIAVLPNGVNFPMFCRTDLDIPPELRTIGGRVLGWVGAITPELDLSPVEYAAAGHPGWTFVLLGRVTENPRLPYLETLPNVRILGHRPMVDVPDYLGRFDVCLDLRRKSQVYDDVTPRRIYEYLSTGKPIVTLLFPDEVEEYPDVIYGAHSLEEFDRMCSRALAEDKSWVSPRRRDYGAAAAWSRRAGEVQRILGSIGLY